MILKYQLGKPITSPAGKYGLNGMPYNLWLELVTQTARLVAAQTAATKNALIRSDTRTSQQRAEAKRQGDRHAAYEEKQRLTQEGLKAIGILGTFARPSTWIALPFRGIEHFGKGFGTEWANVPMDIVTPWAWSKAVQGVKAGGTAVKNAVRGTFTHPSEAFPRGLTSNEPLIARGYNPIGKPIELTVLKIKSGLFTKEDAKRYLEKRKQADKLFETIHKFGNSVSEPKILRTLLNKMKEGTKGKKGTNTAINAVNAEEFAKTPEGQLQAIRNRIINEETGETVWDRLTRNKKETGIDWRDDPMNNLGSYLTGMDTDLKLKPVGFDNKTPFIQRYYDNVITHILDGGYLLKILLSGDLRRNPLTQLWEGKWPDGSWHNVRRPEEYIKARYGREVKGAEIELPKPIVNDGVIYDGVPLHGAGLGRDGMPVSKQENNWIEYIRRPSSAPGKNGYWTVIRDKDATESYAPGHYQLKNYSVPFYKMPKYEEGTFRPGNSYGLMDLIHKLYSGRIMLPIKVQDGVPGVINEYNFGPTFNHNPKSMWNTLDFEPGAGPMAYNKQEKEEKTYA